ncbi:MAG: hypothetical protein PHU51_00820 [Candidatus Nanoarchaeia archaeon]|nr:hypothetical protein [Candidatus Nanoarchaeia archaeon]
MNNLNSESKKIHKNTYSSITHELMTHYFKNVEDCKVEDVSKVLFSGQFNNAKNYMTLDEVIAAAMGIASIKKNSKYDSERDNKNYSVYNVINFANKVSLQYLGYSVYPYLETRKPEDVRMINLNGDFKNYNDHQQRYSQAQMDEYFRKQGLALRLSNLTAFQEEDFKNIFIEPMKEYVEKGTYVPLRPEILKLFQERNIPIMTEEEFYKKNPIKSLKREDLIKDIVDVLKTPYQ